MCQCIVLVVDHWWLAGSPLLTRDCSRQGIHHSNLWYKFSPTESYHFSHCFFWQNPPICKFPCHSQNSLKDLHFVIFMLVQPWVWATENYFSFIIPQFWCFNLIFLWCNLQLDKCEEYYCSLGIPTTDSTSSKSFLCNFGQIFLLINLNWTRCAFQSWDLFLGKYFNYSNITLPNPVGNENSIVLGILRTDCVLALIFQTLVEQIWAG